jgi:undecaprenyl diphosphate synthase
LNEVQSRAISLGINIERLPTHVAIIMDGNGRWATVQGKHRLEGHAQGYATLKPLVIHANDLGIRYLTVYVFSAENWKRPEQEVSGLMELIEHAARAELDEMHANNVRFAHSGRLEELPPGLQEAMRTGIETTKENTGITFTLALNYGGRAEIVDAVRSMVADEFRRIRTDTAGGEERASPDSAVARITEEALSKHLYNPEHPEPDLMIRTAGEMRWSNFLLWQSAYAELWVTQKTWPEFGLDDLLEAVREFQRRTRKFGAVV